MRDVTRRTALTLAFAAIPGWSKSRANFWDEKDPAQWSSDERNRLLTNSPWAKRIEASIATSARSLSNSGKGGGGGGGKRGGSGGGGDDKAGSPPSFNVTVRWESAEPIRLASRNESARNAEAYLISVSGFPAATDPPDLAARLQQGAKLEVKGQGTLHPQKIERMPSDPKARLFYFERAELPVTAANKEIVFTLKLRSIEIAARFNPKEMLYKSTITM